MAIERRSGITRQLLQILQDNVDTVFTVERLAELTDYSRGNVSTLLHQLRKSRPQLIIECPTSGAFVYRGLRKTDEVLDLSPVPINQPTVVKPTKVKVQSARLDAPNLAIGDVCEIIGFTQDGTPLVRDQAGKLYLLNPL